MSFWLLSRWVWEQRCDSRIWVGKCKVSVNAWSEESYSCLPTAVLALSTQPYLHTSAAYVTWTQYCPTIVPGSRIASGLILRAELRLELIVDSSSKAVSISQGRFGGHLNGRTNHLRILNPSN